MMERIKYPDRKNASSIIDASIRQMNYTLTLEATDESAFNIIRNIYECFRMLGDALLVSRGTLVEDHVAQIKALEGLNLDTSKPMILVDKLRRMRHNINYYGYIPSKIEAEDAIEFAKSCFDQVAKGVKQEIDSKRPEKRFAK